MIQPAPVNPTPATASLALPGETLAVGSGEMAETLDFSALLALESVAGEAIPPVNMARSLPGLDGQVLAAETATTGKILPPILPEATADEPQPEDGVAPAQQATEPALPTLVATTLPLAQPQPAAAPAPQEPASSPSSTPQLPNAPAQAASAAMVHHVARAQQQPIRTAAVPKADDTPAEAPAIERPAATSGEARKAAAVAVRFEEARLDLARLASPSPRSDLRLSGEVASALAAPIEGSALAGQSTSASPTAPTALSAAQPAQGQVRPQDFSALIDRLAAAREAMTPHSVAITVAHQDFGPVRLRFRSEDTGLSVAMTSADPGFARAAALAPLPVLPASASDQSGFIPQRGDGGQAPTGHSGGSGRGSTPDRRDEQPQPKHHPTREQAGDRAGARRGIFA